MVNAQQYTANQLLKDAAKHGELVVFIGAGASMLCGSPNWVGFANQVVTVLERNKILSFLEAEQLRSVGDPRRTLSIAMALAEKNNIKIDFDKILHPSQSETAGSTLYILLIDLRPVFVTTNYDKWLDNFAPPGVADELNGHDESKPVRGPIKMPHYYLRKDLSPALLTERGAVIHIHGSYLEPSSMVVSLKNYIEHYADPKVQAFLSTMFKNYTVLFVGYGLAELEILEYIIRSNESLRTDSAEPRHFLLYAHRSTESAQTNFIKDFFHEQCGVQVIPYCIDTKGHEEIVEVFRSWSAQLDVRDPTTLDLQAHLDRCIDDPNSINRQAALRLVSKWPDLSAYLINSLKDPIWFNELDDAGFFNTFHSPPVKIIEEKKGTSYQAEGWPALRYLEQITSLVEINQATRILNIVRSINLDAQQRGLDNWRTWWSMATILSQIPLEILIPEDIQATHFWLTSKFDPTVVGQELGEKLLPRLLDSSDPANWSKAILLIDALSMVRNTEQS